MSRSPLLRGSTLAGETVAVPLRERIVRRPVPDSPEGLFAQARDDAEGVVSAAHHEADALRAAAQREGLATARAQAQEEVAGALAAVHAMARGLDEQRQAMERQAIQEATGLAVEVAARLVRAEVAARPERVVDVLRGAIRRAADRSRLVARVSPADLAQCRAAAPGILEEMGGIARFEVVDDPRILAGSCVLETATGDVDATFESQLARILEALAAPPDETLVVA